MSCNSWDEKGSGSFDDDNYDDDEVHWGAVRCSHIKGPFYELLLANCVALACCDLFQSSRCATGGVGLKLMHK